jgi:hypothetical protein
MDQLDDAVSARRPPVAPHGRPFRSRSAAAHGLTPYGDRSPAVRTRLTGVRAGPEVPDTLETACQAALLLLPPAAVLSHVTALRLHGAEIPWSLEADDRIEVTIPPGGTVSRRPQLRVHTAAARPTTTHVAGMKVAAPHAAWLQVAARSTVDELVVLADALTRRQRPLTSLCDLTETLAAAPPGARGAARAREALALTRPGTDSSMETRARLVIVRAGLPEPLVNRPVLDAAGQFLARPDMQYPAARVAVEYDGDVHRTDPSTWRRDVERRQRLEDDGWVIVTATADDVLRHPERLVARLRRNLDRRLPPRTMPR